MFAKQMFAQLRTGLSLIKAIDNGPSMVRLWVKDKDT